MKLQTTITQTKEIEITLPVFFKEDVPYDNYLAVLDEKTAIDFYVSRNGDCVIIQHTTPDKKADMIQNAIDRNWPKVSEVDFLMAYDDALSAISLRPKLNESFVDSLNVLDLKRNNENSRLTNLSEMGHE